MTIPHEPAFEPAEFAARIAGVRQGMVERNLDGLVVPRSDHLTAYNLYADAYQNAGSLGTVYDLPRHVFDEDRIERWAERRGALVKAIEDAALGMASVYRAVGVALPSRMARAGDDTVRAFRPSGNAATPPSLSSLMVSTGPISPVPASTPRARPCGSRA